MSILTEKQILKPYIKKATGYIKSLLSAQHVEMNNGITLQSTVDQINNNLTLLNSNLSYEYGSNSNGHYKKYADGRLEMWGNYATKAITYTEGYGNIYFSDEKNIVPPITDFIELQSGNVVCRSSGVIWICNCTISGIILKYRICQIGKDLTRSIDICWHAMGRWK